jgi:N-acetylneuraminate synthase
MNPLSNRPTTLNIAGRAIGPGQPVFVIAELSANHGGSLPAALALVEAAADAGADAVKLQTYTPDTMTLDLDVPPFRIESGPWAGRTLYDLYREAQTPWDWHGPLQQAAAEAGLVFLSTPFDETAVAFLEDLNVPAYKIASFELTDMPLLNAVGATGKPVILSTGMASEKEIAAALARFASREVALLKCTSAYPAPAEQMNLAAIPRMAERFGVPVGLSDHSLDPAVPVAAVALGACILEKHLTLNRSKGGPDAAFSLEPAEFKEVIREVRLLEKALGSGAIGCGEAEAESQIFRRSLFAVEDIPAGALFTRENVRVLRPAAGLSPDNYEYVLGRRAARYLDRGHPIQFSDLAQ